MRLLYHGTSRLVTLHSNIIHHFITQIHELSLTFSQNRYCILLTAYFYDMRLLRLISTISTKQIKSTVFHKIINTL